MARSPAAMLAEFHATLPEHDEKGVRLRLHFEEQGELELALEDGGRAEIARELADVVYVAYGTALVWGIDLDAALAEVHRANMAKLPDCEVCAGTSTIRSAARAAGHMRTSTVCFACGGTGKGKPTLDRHGKVVRPKGWQPPDMSGAIGEPSLTPGEFMQAEADSIDAEEEGS